MYNVVRAEVLSALFVKSFLAVWVGLVVISIIVICGIYIKDYLDRKQAREVIVIEEGETIVPCTVCGEACNKIEVKKAKSTKKPVSKKRSKQRKINNLVDYF